MGITSTLKFIQNTTIPRKKVTMKHFIAFSCLLAVAFGAPQYHSSHHSNPYSQKSYNTLHSSGGYQTHSSYHQQKPHKECETHYKTIYKTVIEHEKIKKCEDVPEKICKYIMEKVCHQEEEHKTGYGKGTHGYNSQYDHKPEVCHYETKEQPHKEPHKVPETICTYKKHHSYGSSSYGH